VNVAGIDGHVMERHRLITAGAVTQSNRGPVILIMHQYAHSGKGHSIHSSPQKPKYQQRCGPFYPHTNPEVSACYQSFAVQQCAIIIVPSYKELVKTVNNVLKGHMLRKNP
jgi:hypothetical protein